MTITPCESGPGNLGPPVRQEAPPRRQAPSGAGRRGASKAMTSDNGAQARRPRRNTAKARNATPGPLSGSRRTPGATADRPGGAADAEPADDQVFHEVEAVGAVDDARREPGRRREDADDVLVGGVARVHDPVGVVPPGEHGDGVAGTAGRIGRNREAPGRRPQRSRLDGAVERRRRERVVVDQREIDRVARQQPEGLERLVLGDLQVHRGVRRREAGDGGQQRAADRRGEPGGAQGAGRLSCRVEIETGRVDRREDRHRVLGEAASRRGQPHPPTDRFDEGCADLGGENRDLLGDGRRGDVHLVRDRAHRSEPRQLEQELQATGLHRLIVQDRRTVCPASPRGRERSPSRPMVG